MIIRAFLGLVLTVCATGHADTSRSADSPRLVAADAKLETVFEHGCVVLEGVTSAPDGSIYFSEITATSYCYDASGKFPAAGNIWRLDPVTKEATIFRSPSGMSNALRFDAAGNLVVAEGADFGGRRITRTEMKTGRSYIVTGLYGGKPYNSPNDIAIDRRGRIYFTDPRFAGHEPLEQLIEAVYRIDPDGQVTRLTTPAVQKPNGLGISPDQKRLYVVDSDNTGYVLGGGTHETRGRLLVYDRNDDGSAANERVLLAWPAGAVGDGMTVDEQGYLYIAVQEPGRYGVRVYSPEGKELVYISTGKWAPQSVGFGRGRDANMLYITAQSNLFRIRVRNAGYPLTAEH